MDPCWYQINWYTFGAGFKTQWPCFNIYNLEWVVIELLLTYMYIGLKEQTSTDVLFNKKKTQIYKWMNYRKQPN